MMKTLLIAALLVPTITSAQSLGEAARLAEVARRAGADSPARVYVIRNLDADRPTQPASAIVPTAGTTALTSVADPARGEAYWKDRMRVLEAKLHDNELRLAAAIRTRQELVQFAHELTLSSGRTRRCCDGIEVAIAAVNDAAAEVANSAAAVVRLQEEARLAGVPPGWLRPLQVR